MIYSRFGNELEIVAHDKGSAYVTGRRVSDGREYPWRIDELKADGGPEEIQRAIAAVERGDGEEIPA
jgi:hypothetical protein